MEQSYCVLASLRLRACATAASMSLTVQRRREKGTLRGTGALRHGFNSRRYEMHIVCLQLEESRARAARLSALNDAPFSAHA